MCYCTPTIRTPCCGEKCHALRAEVGETSCPWHKSWTATPMSPTIMEAVLKMIAALQRDRLYNPTLFYLPDRAITAMGGNPEDYPMLEGYPGVRVVTGK